MESFSSISLPGRTGLGGRFPMRTGGYGMTMSTGEMGNQGSEPDLIIEPGKHVPTWIESKEADFCCERNQHPDFPAPARLTKFCFFLTLQNIKTDERLSKLPTQNCNLPLSWWQGPIIPQENTFHQSDNWENAVFVPAILAASQVPARPRGESNERRKWKVFLLCGWASTFTKRK